MNHQNLLVELFVEELPPKALQKLGDAFAGVLLEQLQAQGLTSAHSQLTAFASPRRLAAHITEVLPAAADKAVSQKLMPVAVGLDASGQPTPALLKKLTALGADAASVPQLKRVHDGKAEVLFFESMAKGALLADGLQKALDEAIAKLPIPKVMRYQLQDGWTSVNFVRPAHGLVALHGSEVLLSVQALGQRGAACLAVIKQQLGHAVMHALETRHGRGVGAQRGQFLERRRCGQAVAAQTHGHGHELLRHGLVCGLRLHFGDVRGQAARRGIGGALGSASRQPLGRELLQQHLGKGVAQLLQGLRGQFLDEQFYEQVGWCGHGVLFPAQAAFLFCCSAALASSASTSSACAFGAMGKPRRARLSR